MFKRHYIQYGVHSAIARARSMIDTIAPLRAVFPLIARSAIRCLLSFRKRFVVDIRQRD